ncbi:MAG: hypothetical protein PSV16_07140 [Flavobacterium sp.]|nr:hypothetical protein [Flavobacterium sp.]
MRKFLYISIVFFLSCSSIKEYSLPEKLDPIYIQKATEFAKSQFESCKTQNYIPITEDFAEPWLIKSLTVEVTKSSCAEINEKYGDLIELKIAQTLFYKKNYIYRFKAKYSKREEISEIRVSSNLNHKFNGLIFKPLWTDTYTKFNPRK